MPRPRAFRKKSSPLPVTRTGPKSKAAAARAVAGRRCRSRRPPTLAIRPLTVAARDLHWSTVELIVLAFINASFLLYARTGIGCVGSMMKWDSSTWVHSLLCLMQDADVEGSGEDTDSPGSRGVSGESAKGCDYLPPVIACDNHQRKAKLQPSRIQTVAAVVAVQAQAHLGLSAFERASGELGSTP